MSDEEFIIEPGRQDIIMKRAFDAPAELVFRAFTDPELVPRWMGPTEQTITIDKWDVRPGGEWRYDSRGDDGAEYGFRGVFHSVEAPARIVQTFEFEGMPGHVSLEIGTFEEIDGRTHYTGVSVFQSVEDRDGMAQSGMQDGVTVGWKRLEALLKSL